MTPEAERKLHARVLKLESQMAEQQSVSETIKSCLRSFEASLHECLGMVSLGLGAPRMKKFFQFGEGE